MARRKVDTVTKSEGYEVPFDEEKLRQSLIRAGADDALVDSLVKQVHRKLRPGDSTHVIRRIAMRALKREARHVAGRYNLKRAIFSLGPTGFPFERFRGAILVAQGFEVSVDVVMQGRCIHHEVDVVATKESGRRLAECKFHNAPGSRTDIRVALYCYARSLDLARREDIPPGGERFELVTNTRFTSDATKYAKCVGLPLVGWDMPVGNSLRELVDRHALYPITCLSTLKAKAKKKLLAAHVVTCRELVLRPSVLHDIGLTSRQAKAVLREATPLQEMGEILRSASADLVV